MFAAKQLWQAVAVAVILVLHCGLAQAKGKFTMEQNMWKCNAKFAAHKKKANL